MSKFQKSQFVRSGDSVYYPVDGKIKFVVRHKYANASQSRKHFLNFLVDNFTIEEYFDALDGSTPVGVLRTKGYRTYNELLIKNFS